MIVGLNTFCVPLPSVWAESLPQEAINREVSKLTDRRKCLLLLRILGRLVNSKRKSTWKEALVGQPKYPSCYLPGQTEINDDKL